MLVSTFLCEKGGFISPLLFLDLDSFVFCPVFKREEVKTPFTNSWKCWYTQMILVCLVEISKLD